MYLEAKHPSGATFENEWPCICTAWSTQDLLLLHLSDTARKNMRATTRSRAHMFQVYLLHYRLLLAYYNIATYERALFITSLLLGQTQTTPKYIALYTNTVYISPSYVTY